jgi:hypothetical protein
MIINAENLQIKNVEKHKDDEDVIRQQHDNQQIIRT